jgi:hypothetical protein
LRGYSGIHGDGWVTKAARVELDGGAAGHLVLRAEVLDIEGQRLELLLDGKSLVDAEVRPGPLTLTLPVHASDEAREVELRWAATAAIAVNDPRLAAARVEFLDVVPAVSPPLWVTFPGGLAHPGLEASGIYEDGWMEREASVSIGGGDAGTLIVRCDVAPLSDQRLELVVSGSVVSDDVVAGGELDLRVPVPASTLSRRVELHWSASGVIGRHDPRDAAARLRFIGIPNGPPPPALTTIPGDLVNPRLERSGVHDDGWVEQRAHVVLSGRGAERLSLRADVLPAERQHLELAVDGEVVASEHVQAGPLHLRVPVRAVEGTRRIDLRWATVVTLSRDDPRRVTALLKSIGFSGGAAPLALTCFPHDLADPALDYGGIFDDGWMQEEAFVTLRGGADGDLVIRGETAEAPRVLEAAVNGDSISALVASPGPFDVRLPLPASDETRTIRLRWDSAGAPGPGDPRCVSARLTFIGITPPRRG